MEKLLFDLALKIAVNFGLPYLFEKLPWLANFITKYVPNFSEIIAELVKNLKSAVTRKEKKSAKKKAHQKMRESMGIVAAPSDIVRE